MNKFVTIVLPSLAALYALLTVAWDLPNPVLVLGVLAALTALYGLLTANSSVDEYDGELSITGRDPDTGIPDIALTLTIDPNTLTSRDVVVLKSVDKTV